MKRILIGGIMLSLFACGGGEGDAGAGGDTTAGGAAPAAAAAGGGSVTGVVAFTGAPPANPTIDMSEEAVCQGKYATTPADPVVMVTDGKLANVIVYVKSGLPAGQSFPVPSAPAVIDQEGCLYHPRALAVMVGQALQIKNSDAVLHNIKAVPTKNRGFNISQPRAGMTTERTFTTEEVTVPLECNVHGWMHANVAVFSHPFFASTGPDGSFTISGLPAGTYEIEARHETLGSKTMSVTVPASGSAPANFTFAATTS
ncbi:MAG: carboxypeptidase regulatory-like domain-containing protein [Gemmatimonadaceae bacterium]